jgi:hypothetical protein
MIFMDKLLLQISEILYFQVPALDYQIDYIEYRRVAADQTKKLSN